MLYNHIKTGDRLEVTLRRGRRSERTYISQVEAAVTPDEILIHVPISYGQIVKLSMKDRYSLLFFTERGMIRYDAEIIAYSEEEAMRFLTVKLLSEGERIQRREFFRFTCLLPIKFGVIDPDESSEEAAAATLYDGIIRDLGGGGVRFVADASVHEKDWLQCVIMLSDDCFVLIGKILHKQHLPKTKSLYKYQYRVQFVGILEVEQEKIVQYIFNEQRKLLQKARF